MSQYSEPKRKYKYVPLDRDKIIKRINEIYLLYTNFLNGHSKYFIVQCNMNVDALRDCVLRVNQRECYYEIFHDMSSDDVGEVKRIGVGMGG